MAQNPKQPVASSNGVLLSVENLQTSFFTEDGVVRAVDGVSFYVKEGESLGIVGESGCGKSVTSLSIMRLLPEPQGRVTAGSIHFRGKNLLDLPEHAMRKIRGNEISMIFQEPMTSLNPVFTVGSQIAEAVRLHQGLNKKNAMNKAEEMLRAVSIPAPAQRVREYPHQLSGGMRQRVMIAMALSCNPSLLIADEPTTALDVTVQAQILDLLGNLRKEFNLAMILITHDLGVVAEVCDRVAVMYAGKIVEEAPVREIYSNPKHPYTVGLLHSIPRLDKADRAKRLYSIEGTVPSPYRMPPGCPFEPRCPKRMDQCTHAVPALKPHGTSTHQVRCYLYD